VNDDTPESLAMDPRISCNFLPIIGLGVALDGHLSEQAPAHPVSSRMASIGGTVGGLDPKWTRVRGQ
jgi:hypothetical protein